MNIIDVSKARLLHILSTHALAWFTLPPLPFQLRYMMTLSGFVQETGSGLALWVIHSSALRPVLATS